jgi:hypothetical protein
VILKEYLRVFLYKLLGKRRRELGLFNNRNIFQKSYFSEYILKSYQNSISSEHFRTNKPGISKEHSSEPLDSGVLPLTADVKQREASC